MDLRRVRWVEEGRWIGVEWRIGGISLSTEMASQGSNFATMAFADA
jgi:hypothetical protein